MDDKRQEQRFTFKSQNAPLVEFGVYYQNKTNPRYHSLKGFDFSRNGFSLELSREHPSGLKEEDTLFIRKIGDYTLKKMVIGKIKHFARVNYKETGSDKLKKSYRAGIELSEPFAEDDLSTLKKLFHD
ncbi:MAG: hypothetical protein U0T83_01550 [Bacteriovoracaceae bacterium]